MQKQWLYTKGTRITGPVKSARIANLVLKGELDPSESIQSAETGLWQKIADIPEITEIYHRGTSKPIFSEKEAQRFQSWIEANQGKEGDYDFEVKDAYFYNIPWKTTMLLSFFSAGLFNLYWFFRQWTWVLSTYKKQRRDWRAFSIFLLFAPYIVMAEIEDFPEFRRANPTRTNLKFMAVLWYLVNSSSISSPWPDLGVVFNIGFLLLSIAGSTAIITLVQRYINESNHILGRI